MTEHKPCNCEICDPKNSHCNECDIPQPKWQLNYTSLCFGCLVTLLATYNRSGKNTITKLAMKDEWH